MIVDTARDGWTRVGTLGWRKSLRDKHWAQVTRSHMGWDWEIFRADQVTMCAIKVADGTDISLAAVKDDVDHWARNYRRHAIVIHLDDGLWYDCRLCRRFGFDPRDRGNLTETIARAYEYHAACEAAWQRGER